MTVTVAPPGAQPEPTHAAQRPAPRRPRPNRLVVALLLPAILILLAGMGYPVVWQLITSMQEFGLQQQFGKPAPFVWFDNFAALAADAHFWEVLAKSLVFCIVTAVITLVLSMALALLMQAVSTVPRVILQVSLLLAWAMPVVAAMTVWTWLFDWRRGVANYLLDMIPGVEMHRFNWLADPLTFFALASAIVIWMSVPFAVFSIYAGLTQVSDEVLEAASLDGASQAKRIRLIIVPMIRPVIAIVLLLQLIWDLRVFTQITMLQDAGSKAGQFDLLGTYIYKLGTSAQDFGMASAVSVLVLLITIALSWFYVRSLLEEDAA